MLDRVIQLFVFLAIVGMIVAISLQIVCRVFFDSLVWSEEISRYLLVWSTFLGATMAYKRGLHIAVTFMLEAMPPGLRKGLTFTGILLADVFFIVAVVYGMKYMAMQSFQVSAALRVPMRYVYVVIPVSFFVMVVHSVEKLADVFKKGGDSQ